MKAFAIQTIQRGKDAEGNKRVVLAGKVGDFTAEELAHLDAQGATRPATKEELAVARWEEAEADDANIVDTAAITAKYGTESAPAAAAPATKPKKLTKAEQKAADDAAAAAAAAAAASENGGGSDDGSNGGDGSSNNGGDGKDDDLNV